MDVKQNVRFVVLKALIKVEKEGGYSNIVIDKAITGNNLDARDSSFASKLFYGVIEQRITLDYIIGKYSKINLSKISHDILQTLRMGIYQLIYMDKIPQFAVLNESVKLTIKCKKVSAKGFVNAVLREFLRNECKFELPDKDKYFLDYLEVKYSCPKWLVKLWINDYGEKTAIDILNSLGTDSKLTIRVNTLKTDVKSIIKDFKSKGIKSKESDVLKGAVEVENIGRIEKNEQYAKVEFHVQDISSMICCDILNAKSGETIYDICAAPGGKSFTIAQNMQNKGKIYSFDVHEHKINLIKKGAVRLGIDIINASKNDATNKFGINFKPADKVLCDVPCSGLGVINNKPEIRYNSGIKLDNLANLQYIILSNCAALVKRGGMLIYSTCTLNKLENNYNADKFLSEHHEFKGLEIDKSKYGVKTIKEPKNQMTILPSFKSDGFFIAAFVKCGG
jgi:16S rRNA (cytosine967-C5)-methyltransferase